MPKKIAMIPAVAAASGSRSLAVRARRSAAAALMATTKANTTQAAKAVQPNSMMNSRYALSMLPTPMLLVSSFAP